MNCNNTIVLILIIKKIQVQKISASISMQAPSNLDTNLDLAEWKEQGPSHTYALLVVRYSTGMITWPKEEIKYTDIETRQYLTMHPTPALYIDIVHYPG